MHAVCSGMRPGGSFYSSQNRSIGKLLFANSIIWYFVHDLVQPPLMVRTIHLPGVTNKAALPVTRWSHSGQYSRNYTVPQSRGSSPPWYIVAVSDSLVTQPKPPESILVTGYYIASLMVNKRDHPHTCTNLGTRPSEKNSIFRGSGSETTLALTLTTTEVGVLTCTNTK